MYQLDFLKKVLISLAVLILPILRIVGVIGKGLALTIFFVVLVVLILYGVYQFYYKSLNRDENDFNKFNFGKPDEKQVLMSRLNGGMSEADRQRCLEMEEVGGDINPESLIIIPSHKIDEWKADTCKSPIVADDEEAHLLHQTSRFVSTCTLHQLNNNNNTVTEFVSLADNNFRDNFNRQCSLCNHSCTHLALPSTTSAPLSITASALQYPTAHISTFSINCSALHQHQLSSSYNWCANN